jgi:hypothetical protein
MREDPQMQVTAFPLVVDEVADTIEKLTSHARRLAAGYGARGETGAGQLPI